MTIFPSLAAALKKSLSASVFNIFFPIKTHTDFTITQRQAQKGPRRHRSIWEMIRISGGINTFLLEVGSQSLKTGLVTKRMVVVKPVETPSLSPLLSPSPPAFP